MGLLTQTTDLKSLRYGNDLYQGGSSRQPFVKFKTPSGEALPEEKFGREDLLGQTGGVDQTVRGGSLLPQNIVSDTERITKFLATPQGLEFIVKQTGLISGWNKSLYGDKTEDWPTDYDPTSILTNTAGIALGNHFPNVVFKTGKKPSDNIVRENLYGEGNTYFFDTPSAFVAKRSLRSQPKKTLVDDITYQPLFQDTNPLNTERGSGILKDTVPFYITKISNDGDPSKNVHIHFRSYISGLSDAYKAEWQSYKYMGRGENFYFYNGFSRDIGFKFLVPVLSKYEQASVYSKLNYLASLMAPDYVTTGGFNQGFMRGNLVRITIGDYLINVPGIIQGVNYTIDDEAGWDIAKNSQGNKATINDVDADTGGYIMPKLIEVSNFNFLPIHDFIPKTVSPKFVDTADGSYVDAPFINFGKDGQQPNSTGGYGYANLGQ